MFLLQTLTPTMDIVGLTSDSARQPLKSFGFYVIKITQQLIYKLSNFKCFISLTLVITEQWCIKQNNFKLVWLEDSQTMKRVHKK